MKLGYVKYPDAKFWTVHDEHGSVAKQVKTEELARIFAASPELLDALKRSYLQIIEFLNEGDFKREIVFDAGYIVDAIARAEGGRR